MPHISGIARIVGTWLLVAALLVLARPTSASIAWGLLLLTAGEVLRVWAAGHLVKTRILIVSGPYRYTRNPLYLGRLLIFSGLCLMASPPDGVGWVVLGVGIAVFFFYYLPRKERVEPARLREVHGAAYERYFAAVPALIPSRRPWSGGSLERWSFTRFWAMREPWFVAALVAITAILVWKARAAAGPSGP